MGENNFEREADRRVLLLKRAKGKIPSLKGKRKRQNTEGREVKRVTSHTKGTRREKKKCIQLVKKVKVNSTLTVCYFKS